MTVPTMTDEEYISSAIKITAQRCRGILTESEYAYKMVELTQEKERVRPPVSYGVKFCRYCGPDHSVSVICDTCQETCKRAADAIASRSGYFD
jgi:hypothetical protein